MLEIDIPGFRRLHLANLVCDYNGTLAVDGRLLPGAGEALTRLRADLRLHVITADTFGTASRELAPLALDLVPISADRQAEAKLAFVTRLGLDSVVAIGNGRNDRMMLTAAALGIAVVQTEGAAGETLAGADVVVTGIVDALDVLLHPQRLVATLRA